MTEITFCKRSAPTLGIHPMHEQSGEVGPEDKSLQAGCSETTEANFCSFGGWASGTRCQQVGFW